MSNIALLHYQIGDTDGVSMEMMKWKLVLQEMGHRVFLCAGKIENLDGIKIDEMHHHTRESERLFFNTFEKMKDYSCEIDFKNELDIITKRIEVQIVDFINENKIDLIIPNNIWSIGMNPGAAIALANAYKSCQIRAIAHHHDFYYERVGGFSLTNSTAERLANVFLPPHDPQIKHVVINKLSQSELLERKGIHSVVIPNVFNFDGKKWKRDDYNQDFRRDIGLRDTDILILQATRIVRRKGIELAVDFVHELNKPQRRIILEKNGLYDGRKFDNESRIVLVLAGHAKDDFEGKYLSTLKAKILKSGIDAFFIDKHIGYQRSRSGETKRYSLWDAYAHADLITYPSIWEGWGNQLLEAVYARIPIIIFEYPVFKTEIEDKGFRLISLGSSITKKDEFGLVCINQYLFEQAADQAIKYLVDGNQRKIDIDHNYAVGEKYYSYQSLRDSLQKIL